MKRFFVHALASLFFVCILLHTSSFAQQTNPVDREVSNPITDTPSVNPIATENELPARPRRVKDSGYLQEGGDGNVVVYSEKQIAEGKEGNRIVIHSGNVDLRYGIYRLQADKLTIYEATNEVDLDGNVIFDQGEDQRITGNHARWNLKTKLGYFENATGFTNQTDDGTVIYFTASRVERVSLDEIVLRDGKFTSCDDTVPRWSFTADQASIKTNDRVKMVRPRFRIKDIPLIALPFASISIKKDDRRSGFLTPSFGFSPNKGIRLSNAYFQTLGKSADVTLRGDVYTSRGIGLGFDVRTRANSRSFFNFGLFGVKDRVFGAKKGPSTPDQGGSLFYAEGIHYFPNGFTAAADVRITSNLAFRQVFSDGIQQIISPIEVSQVFLNKSWGNYSLNFLARTQVISIPNVQVKTSTVPSVKFEKRPSQLSFFKRAYFSFESSIEGVSRREQVDDIALYRRTVGSDPIVTPSIGQRFDIHPKIAIPLSTKYLTLTATLGLRSLFYSDSLDGMLRVIGRNLLRNYGELELDLRPVALARNYYAKKGKFRFRHVIEPYAVYRLRRGAEQFYRAIRFDYLETISDTNEFEFGVTNRIFTRRYTNAVSNEAKNLLDEKTAGEDPLSIQPYETFVFTIRGKYFVDPYFGGALIPGLRNQISPITELTAFSFGGVPRRFSPLNLEVTYRPRRTIFANSRLDYGVQGDGLRDISATLGFDTSLVKIFQTFYYTRAVTLLPSLQRFSDPAGKEAGTLRGSQWSPAVFLGSRERGWFGGASLFFDFQNRRLKKEIPLISSLTTLGYAYDCCAIAVQAYTFNVGVRNENRVSFSFRLNGIGTVGTDQIGQGLR